MHDTMVYRGSEQRPALLIVAGAGWVRALERASGRVVWDLNLSDNDPPTLAVHRDRVFVSCSGSLFCIDYWTGQGVWKQQSLEEEELPPHAGDRTRVQPLLLVEGDHVFVVSARATMCFALDGRVLWRTEHQWQTADPCAAVPGCAAVRYVFTWRP